MVNGTASDDGEQLEPVRGLQMLWRSSFGTDRGGDRYDVDADFFDFDEKLRFYVNGRLADVQKSPAQFDVDGGRVEAAMSLYGMKRAHLVTQAGEVRLEPNAGTAEKWREDIDRRYPVASRIVSAASWVILVLALVVAVTEVTALVLPIVGIADGALPRLPTSVSAPLGGLGLVAALDRALMMRHTRWLDS
ncbi:hypothetical protein [Microbacterium amylolyticum]|uniref:Uncharacterized protein n=1 Tax=Microbacterium amylolyticum TaxID=936337 RepID=A0ABS4ZIF8_9MICO|nr:hypothetical protein [Microbacterium amylolyticum]MBP2436276.1 hypothetical protein [Microbacterium amylolyticum]